MVEPRKWSQLLKILFPLLILCIAFIELTKMIHDIDGNVLWQEISQLQFWKIATMLILSLCAVTPMFFYDIILIKLVGIHMNVKQLIKYSFIVNTFSNLIGFGGLVGILLRNYFYANHNHEKLGILKAITSTTFFNLTGISLLTWIVPIHYFHFPLFVELKWMGLIVMAVCLYLPLLIVYYIIRLYRQAIPDMKIRNAFQLLGTSTMEWMVVFCLIWLLTYLLELPIGGQELLPVFLIAACAGILSMIPGGIGSFDLVFLLGMQSLGVQEEPVIVLLILYRLGYFIIPFLLAFIIFVKGLWGKWNQSWNNVPMAIFGLISHKLLTIAVFLSGIILLLSAAVPGVVNRLKFVQDFLALPIINMSHQLTVVLGFILLGLCRGIDYKVKQAYHITMAALIFASIFSILKGLDFEEATFLLIVALLLKASKGKFYRESYVLTWGKLMVDIAVIFSITVMYLIIGYLNLPSPKWHIPGKLLPYVITDYQGLFYSAIIGLIIAGCILLFGHWISKPKQFEKVPSIHCVDNIHALLQTYGGTAYSHLIFTHDKYIFWNDKATVLLPYQIYADKIVVLGNPVGNTADISSTIAELQEMSDLYGYTPVYYEVSRNLLPFLHEFGYCFFKLGEEAFVDLVDFTLTGKRMKSARAIKNKFDREQYTVTIIDPPYNKGLIQQLQTISDEWLHGRKEKGFSLGFFDEQYLNTSQLAVMRGNQGIVGFASLMPMYDNENISVDLMRFHQHAPSGTMDYIFLSLFEWAKESGFKRFNLGMAPLANVGLSKYSFLSERVAAQLFLHGQLFYHFKGLKGFKNKYADHWEPQYVAYWKKSSLPMTMLQLALLIRKRGHIHIEEKAGEKIAKR